MRTTEYGHLEFSEEVLFAPHYGDDCPQGRIYDCGDVTAYMDYGGTSIPLVPGEPFIPPRSFFTSPHSGTVRTRIRVEGHNCSGAYTKMFKVLGYEEMPLDSRLFPPAFYMSIPTGPSRAFDMAIRGTSLEGLDWSSDVCPRARTAIAYVADTLDFMNTVLTKVESRSDGGLGFPGRFSDAMDSKKIVGPIGGLQWSCCALNGIGLKPIAMTDGNAALVAIPVNDHKDPDIPKSAISSGGHRRYLVFDPSKETVSEAVSEGSKYTPEELDLFSKCDFGRIHRNIDYGGTIYG